MKNFQIVSLENEKYSKYDEELERGMFLFFPSSKILIKKSIDSGIRKSFKAKEIC